MWRLAATALLACSSAAGASRAWRTASGREIEAEFVRYSFGVVVLRTSDGNELRVPLARLSPADRSFVAARRRQKKAEAEKKSSELPVRTSPGDPEVVALMKPGATFARRAEGEFGITYHVYVPTSFDAGSPPPLVIAFSPTGKGAGMVKALRASAEKAGWIVAGCDRLRNKMGSGPVDPMEDEVLDDILKSIPHRTDRRCLAGMSGGAMRCYGLLVKDRRPERYFGVLAFGGWLGGRKYARKDYTPGVVVAQINGADDSAANSWLKRDAEALEEDGCVVRHFSFPGGHVIAPPDVIDEAIAWMLEERRKLEAKWKALRRRMRGR